MSEHGPSARFHDLCRAPPQSRDTLALALPLRDARTTVTVDPRPNQIRLLCRSRIYTSAPAVDLHIVKEI